MTKFSSHSNKFQGELKTFGILGSIFLLALVIRLWGIGFGLPYEYHPDEVQYVRQAISMGEKGLQPAMWNNPPFYKYLLFAEYGGYYLVSRLLGVYSSATDFGSRNALDPSWLYLTGRGTTAVIGALTILVAYWAGKTGFNKKVGFLAAGFLAVSFLHVRDSHFAVNDIPATLLITLILVCAFRIAQTGHWRWYIIGGLLLGIGFATKYNVLIGIVPFLAAHLFSPGFQIKNLRFRHLLLIPLFAIAGALISSPYFIVAPKEVLGDVYEALYLAGKEGFEEGWVIDHQGGFVFYIKTLIWGIGGGLFLLSITGILSAFIKPGPTSWILLLLVVTYYIMMGRQQMFFARFILPIVPALLVFSAWAFDWLMGMIRLRVGRSAYIVVFIATLVLVTVQPVANSLQTDQILSMTDTRSQSKAWIEENIPAGSKIAVERRFHAPQLSTIETPSPESSHTFDVLVVGGYGLPTNPLNWYRDQGFGYLVTSSNIRNLTHKNLELNQRREAFYNEIDAEGILLYEISPFSQGEQRFIFDELYGPAVGLWNRQYPGPEIKIYQINSSLSSK